MGKRFFILLVASMSSLSAFSANYDVTIETLVAGKTEDRFSFSMEVGQRQTKGFDGKLFAKRYRAKGYPHRALLEQAEEKAEEKNTTEQKVKKPIDVAQEKLSAYRRDLSAGERRIEQQKLSNESMRDKITALDDVISKGERNPTSFVPNYANYMKKYEPTAEVDENYERLMKKRPKTGGDTEEFDVGSYCSMIITKGGEKSVYANISYAYSRQLSSFYSDGNNNDNSITKFPIFERFEKLNIKNAMLPVGKTFCIQFGRTSANEARSLQDALAQTSILSGSDVSSASKAAAVDVPQLPASPLDAIGLYSEIKRKFSSDTGKTVRVLITIKPVE